MLTVSLAAGCYLARLLDEVEAPTGVAVRLKLERGGRVALRLDHPRERDSQVSHGGRMILLMEPRLKKMLERMCLQLCNGSVGENLFLEAAE